MSRGFEVVGVDDDSIESWLRRISLAVRIRTLRR